VVGHQRSGNINKIIEDLNKEIHDLKSSKYQMENELHKGKHANRPPKKRLAETIVGSKKHQSTIKKMKSFVRQYKEINVILQYFIGKYVHQFADARIRSIVIGFLGFIISIVGQLIFFLSLL
jgi:hypothetical protein